MKIKVFKKIKKILYTHRPVTLIANLIYRFFEPRTIAIVGSIGKTTTKEALIKILEQKYKTRILNENSLEADIQRLVSVIFRLRSKHQILIVEAAINYPNDMNIYSQLIKPDIIIFTEIGYAHGEYFNSSDLDIYNEKIKILSSLKSNGIIILNKEDVQLQKLIKNKNYNIITYGQSIDSNYQIKNIKEKKLIETNFFLNNNQKKESILIKTEVVGQHNVKNLSGAIIAAKKLGCSNSEIISSLKTMRNVRGRLELNKLNKNILLIDDSYNSNPSSVKAMLKTIVKDKTRRKILVFGDMLELGSKEKEFHIMIAKELATIKPENILLIGKIVMLTKKELLKLNFDKKKIFYSEDLEQIMNKILEILKPNDMIVFKASNKINLNIIISKLKKGIILRLNKNNKDVQLPIKNINSYFEVGNFNASRKKTNIKE